MPEAEFYVQIINKAIERIENVPNFYENQSEVETELIHLKTIRNTIVHRLRTFGSIPNP